jgi:hypothetical protein
VLQRVASTVVVWSGLLTATMLAAAAGYFGFFAMNGGLQVALETDAPPEWALTEFEVLMALVALYLLTAVVLTISLAVVQMRRGPWWAVLGGVCALALGAGLLMVASQATQATYLTLDVAAFLGVVGYMVATNVIAFRSRQLSAVTAGVGVGSAVLLVVATLATGLAGVGLLALALASYGAWAASLGISESRRRGGGTTAPAPPGAVLQTGPGDPV